MCVCARFQSVAEWIFTLTTPPPPLRNCFPHRFPVAWATAAVSYIHNERYYWSAWHAFAMQQPAHTWNQQRIISSGDLSGLFGVRLCFATNKIPLIGIYSFSAQKRSWTLFCMQARRDMAAMALSFARWNRAIVAVAIRIRPNQNSSLRSGEFWELSTRIPSSSSKWKYLERYCNRI